MRKGRTADAQNRYKSRTTAGSHKHGATIKQGDNSGRIKDENPNSDSQSPSTLEQCRRQSENFERKEKIKKKRKERIKITDKKEKSVKTQKITDQRKHARLAKKPDQRVEVCLDTGTSVSTKSGSLNPVIRQVTSDETRDGKKTRLSGPQQQMNMYRCKPEL